MPVQVLNIDQVQFREWRHGERFAGKRGDLGRRLGAEKLGYNVTVIPPGKCSYPFHCHRVNEEMFFVLGGEGEVRLADRTQAIRAGDVIACPAGGADTAHQIRNTSSDTELKLLAVSTNLTPEICEYPDSRKFGIYNEAPNDALYFITRGQAGEKEYWEGE
jgi:uncharacterized cupin superfamily protein